MPVIERIAREFHDALVRKAQPLKAMPIPGRMWDDLPHRNKVALKATVAELLERDVIRQGEAL